LQNDFNCDHCKWGRHCDDTNPAPIEQWEIKNIMFSNVCLKPMVTDGSMFMISLYKHYQNRILPFAGGILDQPNIYVQCMNIIESLMKNEKKG